MARILLHYDIHDETYRAMVQQTITRGTNPPFREVTESVYEASFSMVPREYQALVSRLTAAFANPPPGTRIVLEHPDAGPTIVPETIVAA